MAIKEKGLLVVLRHLYKFSLTDLHQLQDPGSPAEQLARLRHQLVHQPHPREAGGHEQDGLVPAHNHHKQCPYQVQALVFTPFLPYITLISEFRFTDGAARIFTMIPIF